MRSSRRTSQCRPLRASGHRVNGRAVRIAQNKRSVTCIIIPNDLQLLTYKDPPLVHGTTHTGVGFPAESKVPDMAATTAGPSSWLAGTGVRST